MITDKRKEQNKKYRDTFKLKHKHDRRLAITYPEPVDIEQSKINRGGQFAIQQGYVKSIIIRL